MLKEVLRVFAELTIGPVAIASILGLVRYKRLSLGLRWLTLLACFDVLMEVTSILIVTLPGVRSNLFLIPIIAIGEVTLIALAYRPVLQSAAFTKTLPWVLGLFSLYALFISFSQLGIVGHAVSLEIINNLLTIGIAGLYFHKLLNELHIEDLRRDPFFWVSAGLVVHGLGNLLISLFSNYLLKHYSVQFQLIIMWGVRTLFNLLLYVSYCVALWMRPAKEPIAADSLGAPRSAW
jgi:hypothetical protein